VANCFEPSEAVIFQWLGAGEKRIRILVVAGFAHARRRSEDIALRVPDFAKLPFPDPIKLEFESDRMIQEA